MIDLSQNFNSLGPPINYLNFVQKNLESFLGKYAGDQYSKYDYSVIEKIMSLGKGQISVTNGSTEAIRILLDHFSNRPRVVLSPTFWEYEFYNKNDSKIFRVNAIQENVVSKLKKRCKSIDKPAVVILCNPNNPTGKLISAEDILSLAKHFRIHDFIIDETYLRFSANYAINSLIKSIETYENVHVVSSLSKIYALPGLRLGYIISNSKNINVLAKLLTPYSISDLQYNSFEYLLKKTDTYIQDTINKNEQNKKRIYKLLRSNNIKFFKTEANFIFIQTHKINIANELKRQGIIVRSGDEFGQEDANYIRLRLWPEQFDKKIFEIIS